MYDNTGLKGEVAKWAKDILEGKQKPNFELERINIDIVDESIISEKISESGKFIYAMDFRDAAFLKLFMIFQKQLVMNKDKILNQIFLVLSNILI